MGKSGSNIPVRSGARCAQRDEDGGWGMKGKHDRGAIIVHSPAWSHVATLVCSRVAAARNIQILHGGFCIAPAVACDARTPCQHPVVVCGMVRFIICSI